MKDFAIIISNSKQTTRLELTTSHDQRIIEVITTFYKAENEEIFKMASTREVYNHDTSIQSLKKFFNCKLNATIRFYKKRGEYKIETL